MSSRVFEAIGRQRHVPPCRSKEIIDGKHRMVHPMCPICQLSITTAPYYVSNCHHVFHNECIHQWAHRCRQSEVTCPICREPLVFTRQDRRAMGNSESDSLASDDDERMPCDFCGNEWEGGEGDEMIEARRINDRYVSLLFACHKCFYGDDVHPPYPGFDTEHPTIFRMPNGTVYEFMGISY